MGKIWMPGGGGGADLDVVTVTSPDILTGKVAVDREGNPLPGTMPNLTDRSTIEHASNNATKVLVGDEAYVSKNTDNVTRAEIRYNGDAGYVKPNTLFAIDQAKMAVAGGLTANKMISGQSAFGIAGSVNVQSILSFSAAVYSSTAITFTWQNPAKGPFSGVIMVGKTGSYPASITDGTRYYKGSGSNSAASGMSSATVTSFASGTTYYFRAFSYAIKDGAEWLSATTYTATVATTKGQQTFTASTIFTIPAGVRSIDLFCVGGGAGGGGGDGLAPTNAGGGGGAGYTTTQKNISVTPGQQINIIVGAGGAGGNWINGSGVSNAGGLSKVTINGQDYCIANGGSAAFGAGSKGGSGGGGGGRMTSGTSQSAGNGGSNGSNGFEGYDYAGAGQGTTTRAFGESSNTLYAGGGGGGGNGQRANSDRGFGGAGGGGNGADAMGNAGSNGTPGTGGGGGGGYQYGRNPGSGYAGGSGICLIRWGY